MEKFRIKKIDAREIIDNRGFPTVQVDVLLESGVSGRADVPVGKSTGKYEAVELRDGGKRFDGRGVRKAVKNVKAAIGPKLIGQDVRNQRRIDQIMIDLDGTKNKAKLGANAIVGVSLATARAAAVAVDLPLYKYININAHILPVPMINLINGGEHASNDLAFQEFIIAPVGAENFMEAMQISTEVNIELRDILIEKYGKISVNVGDEGGFAPPITNVIEAMGCLEKAVKSSRHESKILYGLDVASTHFYNPKTGRYEFDGKELTKDEMIEMYKELTARFPIVSIEDPLYEEDLAGTAELTKELGIQIVGDDLFVTNSDRLRAGIEQGAANSLLWKVNQIGTLSEAMDAAQLAYRNGYGVMVSERSGETEDPIIADLVVALNTGQIKTGAPVRGERTAKYNRLLVIEEELGSAAAYAGRNFVKPF